MTAKSRTAGPTRAFQWDLARQVERLDVLLALLPRYAEWGYQELYLHLEDAVHYPSLPGVGRPDAYRYEDLEKLVETAKKVGIGVVPIVNLLGHTQYLIKVPELRDLNELRARDGSPAPTGQICPLHPRMPEVASDLLRDMAPFCTAGKIHVGLDESFHLGRCPRCRAEVASSGLAGHFASHVDSLHRLTLSLGLRLGLWADMLYFIPEAIPLLPRGIVAYDWYYYPFRRHPKIELYNFAEVDLTPALRAQGIEYWGCAMNGAFRYEPLPLFKDRLANARSWWDRCLRTGAGGFLMTSWEAYRLAFEMPTVVDAAAADLWLDPQAKGDIAMMTHGFERLYGQTDAKPAALAALSCDRYPFSGYARWEINDRWDVVAPGRSITRYRGEARFFAQRSKTVARRFAALSASIRFRHYLARRDFFVRAAAQGVFRLRQQLRAGRTVAATAALRRMAEEARSFAGAVAEGRKAARIMRTRSRDRRRIGQNEAIVQRDAARLKLWRRWLTRCRRDVSVAWDRSPVAGRWQLIFVVHNFAPAVQRVVVEQKNAAGQWVELHSRHTIEFQATAATARPLRPLSREFSLPVDDTEAPLRISTRGTGQVKIANVVLTNGVDSHPLSPPKVHRILGEAAPSSGLPDLSGTTGEWVLPRVSTK